MRWCDDHAEAKRRSSASEDAVKRPRVPDVDKDIRPGCKVRPFFGGTGALAHPDQHSSARSGRVKDINPEGLKEPDLKELGGQMPRVCNR
jgi:hypothetical protein